MIQKLHFQRLPLALFFSVGVWLWSAAYSSAHSDIFLANVSGQVNVGGANELGTVDVNFDLTTHVFQGVMVPDFPPPSPADYGRDEPGFFALGSGDPAIPAGATALPGSAAVSIQFPVFTVGTSSDSLFYWNGAGAVDFQPISTAQPGVGLSLHPNPLPAPGTNPDGSLHQHSAFELALGPWGGAVPADGVYLISPTASVAGLTPSKPFYMLFLVDALIEDEEYAEGIEGALESSDPTFNGKNYGYFNAATTYVSENLAVPEPGSLTLLGLACTALVALSRRQAFRGGRRGRCI